MLLKMLVSPEVWRYLANWISHLLSAISGRAVEVFYMAAELEPGGLDW
jgi:hypothetical protein